MLQAVGRAKDAARRSAVTNAVAPGLLGAVLSDPAPTQDEIDNLEEQIAKDVSLTAANAEPVSFTCQPCGGTFSLDQGAYTPAGRVYCWACFEADAEARRLAQRPPTGLSQDQAFAVVMGGLVVLTIIIFLLTRK